MTKAQIRKNVFLKSIPIMCSYIFVSMAYGIMMEKCRIWLVLFTVCQSCISERNCGSQEC